MWGIPSGGSLVFTRIIRRQGHLTVFHATTPYAEMPFVVGCWRKRARASTFPVVFDELVTLSARVWSTGALCLNRDVSMKRCWSLRHVIARNMESIICIRHGHGYAFDFKPEILEVRRWNLFKGCAVRLQSFRVCKDVQTPTRSLSAPRLANPTCHRSLPRARPIKRLRRPGAQHRSRARSGAMGWPLVQ